MAMSFAEKDIDDLIESNSMIIDKDILWKPEINLGHWKFSVPIKSQSNHNRLKIRLTGTKSLRAKSYSFSLLVNTKRVRGLDPVGNHKSPQSHKLTPNPHKHKYTDEYGISFSYTANDISDISNLESTLMEFLNECKIQFTGKYSSPNPVQLKLKGKGLE